MTEGQNNYIIDIFTKWWVRPKLKNVDIVCFWGVQILETYIGVYICTKFQDLHATLNSFLKYIHKHILVCPGHGVKYTGLKLWCVRSAECGFESWSWQLSPGARTQVHLSLSNPGRRPFLRTFHILNFSHSACLLASFMKLGPACGRTSLFFGENIAYNLHGQGLIVACRGRAVKSTGLKLWCFWPAECGFESRPWHLCP